VVRNNKHLNDERRPRSGRGTVQFRAWVFQGMWIHYACGGHTNCGSLWKEIGKGERVALSKLAVEHLERTQRPLRIAIDAAIWNFQNQAGQGGKNPALRTLFYRLLRLLALPIHPVFVYDGKSKPLTKRGKTVSRYGTCIPNEMSKKLVQAFRYPHHTAPGEAEAECALLQRKGIVDAVMSQDVDALMFGSALTLRDWSKEGSAKGNKTPTHVNLLDLPRIKSRTGLDPDGMILVALLSGGDYHEAGVPGFGPALACEVARAGFGTDLLDLVRKDDNEGLREWRARMQYELETNESGYFKTKHKAVRLPDTFPDPTIVGYYMNPAVTADKDLPQLERAWSKTWEAGIDIVSLRQYVGETFDWLYKPGAWKFVRNMAPALLAQRLRQGLAEPYIRSVEQITERRQHFLNDGLPELRVAVVPVDVVGLDLDAEEDSPEYVACMADEQDGEEPGENAAPPPSTHTDEAEMDPSAASRPKKREAPRWNPYAPERLWIPETIVQLGASKFVEEWQQIQRDLEADPKKFASRKCRKEKETRRKQKIGGMQAGAILDYLHPLEPSEVPGLGRPVCRAPLLVRANVNGCGGPKMPPPEDHQPPALEEFFKPSKTSVVSKVRDRAKSRMPCQSSDRAGSNQQEMRSWQLSRPTTSRISGAAPCVNTSTAIQDTPSAVDLSSPEPLESADKENVRDWESSPTIGQAPSDMEESATIPSLVQVEKAQRSSQPFTPDNNQEHTTGDLPELSSTVTQRKKRSNRSQGLDPPSPLKNPNPKSRSIESFFVPYAGHGKGQAKLENHGSAQRTIGTNEERQDPPTTLPTRFSSSHVYASPRDSLPGTWKELAFGPQSGADWKRAIRVSCVDLTGD